VRVLRFYTSKLVTQVSLIRETLIARPSPFPVCWILPAHDECASDLFVAQPAVGGIFYDADGKGATVELVPRAPYGTGKLPAIESFFYTLDNSWPQIGTQPGCQTAFSVADTRSFTTFCEILLSNSFYCLQLFIW
jgi:hypothetical protein